MTGLLPTCARTGCERRPTRYLELLVPAVGHGIDRALKITIGLAMCKDHAGEATAAEFVNDTLGEITRTLTSTMRLAKPDLDRAELRVRMLGGDNWRGFIAGNAAHQGGGTT